MELLRPIDTIQVNSKEQVHPSYIYEFIMHALHNNKIKVERSSSIFYSYLSLTQEYQISCYNPKEFKEGIPFEYLDCSKDRIYIHADFFAVTKNRSLYYYQLLPQVRSVDEIKEYVKRRLKITLNEVIVLQSIPKEKRVSTNITYLQKINYKYTGLYASLYIGLLVLLSWGWIQNSQKNILKHMAINQEERLLEQLQQQIYFHPTIYKQTKVLMNRFKENQLQLLKYSFTKNQLHLQLSSHSKQKLYYFLSLYSKQTEQSHIEYMAEKRVYVLHTTITPT